MPRPNRNHDRAQEGAALVLVLVLTAGVTAALSMAISHVRPAERMQHAAVLSDLRLDAVADALTAHFVDDGQFPVRLTPLVGRGRVSQASLEDPFRGQGQLGYRFEGIGPDSVVVYSAGPDGRDELGGGDDRVRRVSGALIGRVVTHERMGLVHRVVEGLALDAASAAGADAPASDAVPRYLDALPATDGIDGFVAVLSIPAGVAVDGWGTALRLLPLGRGLRSAGADRKYDTPDDLVRLF